MNTETKIDRAGWGEGPWDNEPDRIEWESHGFPCLMRRTDMGNWCGYVAVLPGHPVFEKNYNDVDVNVHGGLTYAEHCHGSICHVPKPGEPDNVWWLGFDCAHGGDVVPSYRRLYKEIGLSATAFTGFDDRLRERYRDVPYVRDQIEHLAAQLSALSKASPEPSVDKSS